MLRVTIAAPALVASLVAAATASAHWQPAPLPAGLPEAVAAKLQRPADPGWRLSRRLAAVSGPGPLIVSVQPGGDLDALARDLRSLGRVRRVERALGAVLLEARDRDQAFDRLRSDARVAAAEDDAPRRHISDPYDAVDPMTGLAGTWAYDRIGAAAALAAVGGGSNQIVAVVDTGVDASHPDLAGRVLPGHDSSTGFADAADFRGHGTFVAGLVSAIDGNGIGGRGVAGATSILPVRASISGDFSPSAIAGAITWATDNGARVINLSLGGQGGSEAEQRALAYATSREVVIVAASGNGGENGPPEFPASAIGGTRGGWSIGLSVAATDPSDQPASFSTAGDSVTIAAPGAAPARCTGGVLSTLPSAAAVTRWDDQSCNRVFGIVGDPAGRYAYGEGTSFAAPLVAGSAALVRTANPGLSAGQTADVLRRSARQTVGVGWNRRTGMGVVDAAAAVALARRYDTAPPRLELSSARSGSLVRVRAHAADIVPAGADAAAGVPLLRLEASTDRTTWSALGGETPAALDRVLPVLAGSSLWVRVTACDGNRSCTTRTTKRLRGPRVGVSVRLRSLGTTPDGARVRVSLAPSDTHARGAVRVQRFVDGRYRTVATVYLNPGDDVTRPIDLPRGSSRLRAHLVETPVLRGADSRTVVFVRP